MGSQPKVSGGIPPSQSALAWRKNAPPPPIYEGMRVRTERSGRAEIALTLVKEGKVRLGPGTVVLFNKQVIHGNRPVMTLRQQVGQLRLVLIPQGPDPGEGQYWIVTETGTVRVLGTDVYVRTGRWGMVVAVAEGKVEVEDKRGRTVTVQAGEWTYVAVDRPPAPPRSTPPDGGGEPPPGFPGDPFLVDPPQLDFRFNLPR